MNVRIFLLAIGVLLGISKAGWGVEARDWSVVKQFNFTQDGFVPAALSVVEDDDVWLAGAGSQQESVIYHFSNGVWSKESGVPDIGGIGDIALANSNKGWAMGENGTLAYDGIFWTVIPDANGSEYIGHLISITENLVWYAENSDITAIVMKDDNKGYYSTYWRIYQFDGVSWSSILYIDSSSWTVDNNDRIWYIENLTFNDRLRVAESEYSEPIKMVIFG